MRIERELLKGVLPLAVLRLLNRRAMYGYELITELEKRTEGVLQLGQSTLYPLLYNLEAGGLITGEWMEGDNRRNRKYYRLTDDGRKRLARDLTQWEGLVRGMSALVAQATRRVLNDGFICA